MAVFVFGSNLAGRHGAGAAREAKLKHGAVYGRGYGHYGNSFAIPTKDGQLKTLPLDRIQRYVTSFLEYARKGSHLEFQLTAIGCGLAGYRPEDIAPMFADAPPNVLLPKEFDKVLGR